MTRRVVTFNGGILAHWARTFFSKLSGVGKQKYRADSIQSPVLIAGQPVDAHDAEESDEERGSVEAWQNAILHGDTGGVNLQFSAV